MILYALALIAQVATAPTAAAVPIETAQAKPKNEAKLCKLDPKYTGTRMRKKLCLTLAEWDIHNQGKSADDLKTIGAR